MEKKPTAVEWLHTKLSTCTSEELVGNINNWFEQAKAMEKEQMDKVAGDWWNEGASYMHDGKRKYESFEQYYNETYKGGEQ